VEILTEIYNDATGAHVIATYTIQIFPFLPPHSDAPKAVFSTYTNKIGAAWLSGVNYVVGDVVTDSNATYSCAAANSNHEPPNTQYWTQLTGSVNAFQGDPPRLTIQVDNLFPGSNTWLVIYPNNPVTNPTQAGAVPIPNTNLTDTRAAPITTMWSRTIIVELGPAMVACGVNNSVTTPQEYTIAVVQKLPVAYTDNACVKSTNNIASSSFTMTFGFKVQSQIGRSGP
jgi:hypothetical protein